MALLVSLIEDALHVEPFQTNNKGQMPNNYDDLPLPPDVVGTLINDKKEDPELAEIERKIDLLNESKLILNVTNEVHAQLQAQADFQGITVEEYAVQVLAESTKVAIGAPTINAPSFMSGQKTEKITGPSRRISEEYYR